MKNEGINQKRIYGELEIYSLNGIRLDNGANIYNLSIPKNILQSYVDRNQSTDYRYVVREIHREIFNDSDPLGCSELPTDFYVVEFSKSVSLDRIQEFVDTLETKLSKSS